MPKTINIYMNTLNIEEKKAECFFYQYIVIHEGEADLNSFIISALQEPEWRLVREAACSVIAFRPIADHRLLDALIAAVKIEHTLDGENLDTWTFGEALYRQDQNMVLSAMINLYNAEDRSLYSKEVAAEVLSVILSKPI